MASGRLLLAIFALLLLSGCGGRTAPQFVQAFGGVDGPCQIGANASELVQHCTAHVVLVNQGGEGFGRVTMVVPLKEAKNSSAAGGAMCAKVVPDTPSGAYADLTCDFDIPVGKTVASYPVLKSIDYVGASSGASSGFDYGAVGTMLLAGATVLLAAATLVTTLGRRPAVEGQAAVPEEAVPSEPVRTAEPAQPSSKTRSKIDADYDLPELPR